ncbi:MAG TPA: NAD(P)-dependent oxidoreductase [Gemmataceae bacterium]|nr:NAD(P)-dependent oxidoreductase [Gemmataceae bacterium]
MFIALTGATGFLGRYLVQQIATGDHRLRCWYRPSSDRSAFEKVSHQLEWLAGSLGDQQATERLVKGVDAVVHAAVQWPGPRHSPARARAQTDLDTFLQTNLMGSLQLFQAARAAGAGRFVFISTCAVHEVILEDRPLDETHPLWPMRPYGAHKAALEKFVHSYGLGERWPICALRPTGIYGLAHPAAHSRWYDLVGQVLRGESIASAAGGKEVHAADVAKAVQLLLTADPEAIAGQAFNCYDRYISEQEVAQIAKRLTGSRSAIADLNRGPKHQICTDKIRGLGMTFGGETQLCETVAKLIRAHQGQATQGEGS